MQARYYTRGATLIAFLFWYVPRWWRLSLPPCSLR